MNHGAGLAINSGQQVENLPVQRKVGLRIECERANQRHFPLGHQRDNLFFRSRDESRRHGEDLLFPNQALDVGARGRRRVTSFRELHLKLAVVNSALTVKFIEVSGRDGFDSLAHVRQCASGRERRSNYDLAFTDSGIRILAKPLQIDDQIEQVLA